MIHPLNEFPKTFLQKFAKKVAAKLAVGHDHLEGVVVEKIVANILKVPWRRRSRKIIDIVKDNVGVSVKSKDFDPISVKKPDKNKRVRISLGSDFIGEGTTAEFAASVIRQWNERLQEAYRECPEVRVLMIFRDSDCVNWAMYECLPKFYDVDMFSWEWNKKNNLVGTCGDTKLTWRNCNLTLSYTVPNGFRKIEIPHPRILTEDEILKIVGIDLKKIKIT